MTERGVKRKLHGREFYESIGSPKFIVAPMVDQSEFAWRMLTRSFMTPETDKSLLAYTPMFHARMFRDTQKYRENHFQPLKTSLPTPSTEGEETDTSEHEWRLDGNPSIDRPLFVQFCANQPDEFLEAAKYVAPFCDAVDLNLGCPQGIAKKGRYGAFLQEDWETIHSLISNLHKELSVPVTAKFRIQETNEKTLEYAKMILSAGASIITVHGRQREQKGHNTGLADWSAIRYLRDNLPSETVLFANGNILHHDDIAKCLEATGADGVMSAEGNLYDPSIFATAPPKGQEGREYWRGRDGRGGFRADASMRRYMDIIHRYVLEQEPPVRPPLYMPGDPLPALPDSPPDPTTNKRKADTTTADGAQPTKRQKRQEAKALNNNNNSTPKQRPEKEYDPNLTAMQAHLFHLLRSLVAVKIPIRDALARTRTGDIPAFERILSMVEHACAEGIRDYHEGKLEGYQDRTEEDEEEDEIDPTVSSIGAIKRCARPWFVCQSRIRPLPSEAIEKGAMQVSKKVKRRMEVEAREREERENATDKVVGEPEGRVERVEVGSGEVKDSGDGNGEVKENGNGDEKVEIPRKGLVCG